MKLFSVKALRISSFLIAIASQLSFAYDGKTQMAASSEKPAAIENVGIEEKLNTQLDLNLKFKNEKGEEVTLGSFFDGKHPVIISPVYYSCPSLCNFHLNGLTEGLKGVDWNPGDKFQIVAISFDPSEDHNVAGPKKVNYLKEYGRAGTENGWHFLTGDEENIKKLTSALGFKYKWNEEAEEWAHASAAIITTPKGIISRYLPGITFEAKDIKLALNEATNGKIGTFVESLVLYCFKYDPHTSKYSLYAFNLLKLGGAITILLMMVWLLPVWFRNRKTEQESARSV